MQIDTHIQYWTGKGDIAYNCIITTNDNDHVIINIDRHTTIIIPDLHLLLTVSRSFIVTYNTALTVCRVYDTYGRFITDNIKRKEIKNLYNVTGEVICSFMSANIVDTFLIHDNGQFILMQLTHTDNDVYIVDGAIINYYRNNNGTINHTIIYRNRRGEVKQFTAPRRPIDIRLLSQSLLIFNVSIYRYVYDIDKHAYTSTPTPTFVVEDCKITDIRLNVSYSIPKPYWVQHMDDIIILHNNTEKIVYIPVYKLVLLALYRCIYFHDVMFLH